MCLLKRIVFDNRLSMATRYQYAVYHKYTRMLDLLLEALVHDFFLLD